MLQPRIRISKESCRDGGRLRGRYPCSFSRMWPAQVLVRPKVSSVGQQIGRKSYLNALTAAASSSFTSKTV